MENKKELNEHPVDDDYAVYWDYYYVADGKVIRSDIKGTAADLRIDLQSQGISADVIMNCDLDGRNIIPNFY